MLYTRETHPAIEAFLYRKSYIVANGLTTVWLEKYGMQVLYKDRYAIIIYSPGGREVLFRTQCRYAGYIDATTELVPFIVERLVERGRLDLYVSINIDGIEHRMCVTNSRCASSRKYYVMEPTVWYSVSLMGTVAYMDDTGYLKNILADIGRTEISPQTKPVQITFQDIIGPLI